MNKSLLLRPLTVPLPFHDRAARRDVSRNRQVAASLTLTCSIAILLFLPLLFAVGPIAFALGGTFLLPIFAGIAMADSCEDNQTGVFASPANRLIHVAWKIGNLHEDVKPLSTPGLYSSRSREKAKIAVHPFAIALRQAEKRGMSLRLMTKKTKEYLDLTQTRKTLLTKAKNHSQRTTFEKAAAEIQKQRDGVVTYLAEWDGPGYQKQLNKKAKEDEKLLTMAELVVKQAERRELLEAARSQVDHELANS